jgi:hypothetical protein
MQNNASEPPASLLRCWKEVVGVRAKANGVPAGAIALPEKVCAPSDRDGEAPARRVAFSVNQSRSLEKDRAFVQQSTEEEKPS